MRVLKLCAGASALLWLQACGEAQFAQGTGREPPADVVGSGEEDQTAVTTTTLPSGESPTTTLPPFIDETEQKATSLTWFWQCDAAPGPAPAPGGADDVVIVGNTSNTEFNAARFAGVPMTVQGEFCPLETQRDIVFVIDVSGSMNGVNQANDPRMGNTCGRLEAMQSVIASATQGASARFAGVTFSNAVSNVSSAFATSIDGVFAGNLANTVCAAGGGTNYTASLERAEQLLASARASASKEIYFLTDGQPDNGGADPLNNPDINGVAVAARLRAAGVTVVTVMLGSDVTGDNHLRTRITSTSPSGDLLHANAANASQLASTMTRLAQNDVSIGEVRYRPIGGGSWSSYDLLGARSGNKFELPEMIIDVAQAPYGLEMEYSYRDRRGKTYSSSGAIRWAP
jgi:Mg-chelatase subunit ChlD